MRPPEGDPGEDPPARAPEAPTPPTYPPVVRPPATPSASGWATPAAPGPSAPPAPVAPPVPPVPRPAAPPAAAPAPPFAPSPSLTSPISPAPAEPAPDRGRHLGLVLSILGLIVMVIAVVLLFQGDDDPQATRTVDGTDQSAGRSAGDDGGVVDVDPTGDATADPADDPGLAIDEPTTTTDADPTFTPAADLPTEASSLGRWRIRVTGASSLVDLVHVQVAISWSGSGTGDPADLAFLVGFGGATHPAGGPGCPVGSDEVDGAQIGSDPVEAQLCFLVPEADLSRSVLLVSSTANPNASLSLDLQ